MPGTLIPQVQEQAPPPIPGFRLDNKKLVARLDALKKEPTEAMLAFKAAHPEFKEFNCAFLAAFCGLSESTLKKLKLGQIADPRASTFWLLWHAFGIFPGEILDMPQDGAEGFKRLVRSDPIKGEGERVERLRAALASSEAKSQALSDKILTESVARSAAETETKHNKRLVRILGCVAAVLLGVILYVLLDATHRGWGVFR